MRRIRITSTTKYLNELVPGKFLPETRAGLLAIADRMKKKIGVDGVILAGTELPLILRDADHKGLPFLDTTKNSLRSGSD